MKKLVYKFLDNYLGNEVKVEQLNVPLYKVKTNKWGIRETFYIWSGTNELILSFCVLNDSISIWRGEHLCNKVSQFFSIDSEVAMRYVRDWFADKHNLNKINDLLKFIPTPA